MGLANCSISASQFIGAPLKMIDRKFYEEYMSFTKQSFAVLVTTITQWWAPTVVRVSGDESVKGQMTQLEDGSLRCKFPERIVFMANHQVPGRLKSCCDFRRLSGKAVYRLAIPLVDRIHQ